jgi:transcription antitermination factor NusG
MKSLMENWRGYIQESEDDFSPHTMYDPKSGKTERAETKERHLELADRGYTHVDPEKLRDIINKEGGAAGLDAIVDQADASEEEVRKTLDAMDDVATHKEGDLVIDDGDEVEISEGEICDAGIQYVLRTDPGGKDIHRGDEDTDGDGENEIKNWSARAAQIASKKCKDPDYGTGKSKKNEAQWGGFTGGAAPLDEPSRDSGPIPSDQLKKMWDIYTEMGMKPEDILLTPEFVEAGIESPEQLQEDCWDGYERVEGTEEGAPGSCRKKTDEGIGEMRSFQVGDQVRVVDGGLRGATGKIIEPITLVTGAPGFVILLDSPADKRVFGQAGDEVPVAADKLAPPVSAMTEAEGGLKAWEKENWTHSDGTPCGGGKEDGSTKRCKPASKWKTMSKGEKAADNAKKKKANKAGKYSVSATKKGKVTKSHTKRNESIFKTLRESLDNIEEAADYGNFPDEVLNYLQEKPNRVINGAMLAYAFGGAQQRHDRMLQMMAQQGKLEYKDGHYRLASLTEDEIEEAARCDGPTKKASSDAKGKKWMKCVKSDSGGYKRIHWGQKGVRVTGKSGDTKRKKSFKARHGCANAKANTPKGQACKDWA